MSSVWNDTHLLTTVFLSEADQSIGKDDEEAVKEIYDVELTAVDAGQKIKIIKILR